MFGEKRALPRLTKREAERQAEAARIALEKIRAVEDDYMRLLVHAQERTSAAAMHYATCLATLDIADLVAVTPVKSTMAPLRASRMAQVARARAVGR